MKLTRPQLQSLTRLIEQTRPAEIDCDDCLGLIAEFAEYHLEGRPLTDAIALVDHHLAICPCCRDEYAALRRSLAALERNPDS